MTRNLPPLVASPEESEHRVPEDAMMVAIVHIVIAVLAGSWLGGLI